MIERLPYYYRKSKVVKDLYDTVQRILDKTNADISDADKRLFIVTTDNFDLHEKDVSLTAAPELDAETRRARVMVRLQGSKVLTVEELYGLILLYEKSGCEIKEIFGEYTILINFDKRRGKPPNLEQIQEAVEEVKPAHIKCEYEFRRNTWGDANRKFGLWGNGRDYTWGKIEYYGDVIWLYVDGNGDVWLQTSGANAQVVFEQGKPYAEFV